jgi:hypothetical protein
MQRFFENADSTFNMLEMGAITIESVEPFNLE